MNTVISCSVVYLHDPPWSFPRVVRWPMRVPVIPDIHSELHSSVHLSTRNVMHRANPPGDLRHKRATRNV